MICLALFCSCAGPIISSRQTPMPQNCISEHQPQPIQQSQSQYQQHLQHQMNHNGGMNQQAAPSGTMTNHQQQQSVEYYQKQSDINEKNYHHPNVIATENYSKKESYNFIASPNLLQQHQDNIREDNYNKYKQNYNRELMNLRETNHNNIYNKRPPVMMGGGGNGDHQQQHQLQQQQQHYAMPPMTPSQQQNIMTTNGLHNHHHNGGGGRDNFNITENPNLCGGNNRDNYNIRENYISAVESFSNGGVKRGMDHQMNMRNQFNNNYATRDNEPLLHSAPIAKVSECFF